MLGNTWAKHLKAIDLESFLTQQMIKQNGLTPPGLEVQFN